MEKKKILQQILVKYVCRAGSRARYPISTASKNSVSITEFERFVNTITDIRGIDVYNLKEILSSSQGQGFFTFEGEYSSEATVERCYNKLRALVEDSGRNIERSSEVPGKHRFVYISLPRNCINHKYVPNVRDYRYVVEVADRFILELTLRK